MSPTFKHLPLIALVTALATLPTLAPAEAQQNLGGTCRYAGMQFSYPTTVRDGDKILTCNGTNWYVDDRVKTTNCWFASSAFTAGAVVSEGDHSLSCQPDGTWAEVAGSASGSSSGQ